MCSLLFVGWNIFKYFIINIYNNNNIKNKQKNFFYCLTKKKTYISKCYVFFHEYVSLKKLNILVIGLLLLKHNTVYKYKYNAKKRKEKVKHENSMHLSYFKKFNK